MQIDITKQEAWKILDAIVAYKKDYELSKAILATFKSVEKKMTKIVNEDK